jgi:hypothetical protein
MKQYGIVIEGWHWKRKNDVRHWLGLNFGPEGRDRWGTEYDYGLENLWMNEDVYIMYKLKWP